MPGAVTIVGEVELKKRLDRLASDGARRRMARPAIREAAAEIRKAAKALAPVDTGLLKKSIKSVVRTSKKQGVVYAVIGPATGMGADVVRDGRPQYADPAKYAHLVEYGTAPHVIQTKTTQSLRLPDGRFRALVHHPGAAAKPFLRPAYDSVPAQKIIARRMAEELDKEARRR